MDLFKRLSHSSGDIVRILNFVQMSEKLKKEMRHSWLSDGRRESVAEHSWMLSILALLTYRHLDEEIDIEKALKMVAIHDIVEIEVGDIPFTEKSERKNNKKALELSAINKIRNTISGQEGNEFYDIWIEFEACNSNEAKFVKALDNLEVQMQHNMADLKTWEDIEFDLVYTKMDKYCKHDKFLSKLCDSVKEWAEKEMDDFGVNKKDIKYRSMQ